MTTAEKYEFVWPTVVAVGKALLNRAERGPLLKRFGLFMGKWLLGGVVVSVVVTLGEIWSVGPAAAWVRFGTSWFVIPIAVVLIPVAFFMLQLVTESVVLLVFGLLILPSLLFKDEKRWFRILGRTAVIACLAIVALLLLGVGASIATSPGPPHPPAASSAVPIVPAAPPPSTAHLDVVGLLKTHPWFAAALACLGLAILKKLADDAYDGVKRLGKHLGKKFIQ